MKNRIIYLEWADAVSAPDKWWPDENLERWIKSGGWLVKQVGFLLKETEHFIVVSAMKVDESEFSQGFHGHITKIPKGWIVKRRFLK